MAGDLRSWTVVAALAAAAVVQPLGCDSPTDEPAQRDPALTAMLAAVGPSVVRPGLSEAIALAGTLAADTAALAEDPTSSAAREAAQGTYADLVAAWQHAEVHQIGPLASSLHAVAGADVRDEIYSWPTVNVCRVDQETASEGYASDAFFAEQLVNVYGLDALDTLLFSESSDNRCPPQVAINADGTWDALGEETIRARRAAYAAVVAEQLHSELMGAERSWAPEGDDYSAALADAGLASSPYATQQSALNAVYDALFYLETRTKDRKLAPPLGLRDCTEEACLDEVEMPLSGLSTEAVRANLEGFRVLFTGADADGLDDLLASIGQASLASDVLAAVDAALLASDEVTLPLDEAVFAERAEVEALYQAVVALTDLLKGELVAVLAVQIPSEAAGDND